MNEKDLGGILDTFYVNRNYFKTLEEANSFANITDFEGDVQEKTQPIIDYNVLIQYVLNSKLYEKIVAEASKKVDEDLKFQCITTALIDVLKEKLSYTSKGFVLKTDTDQKIITSPGQLGLAIFQLLNDAILIGEKSSVDIIDKTNNIVKATKENDNFWN